MSIHGHVLVLVVTVHMKTRYVEQCTPSLSHVKFIHFTLLLIIHEKKERQGNTTQRQSNSTQLAQGSYFSKKN